MDGLAFPDGAVERHCNRETPLPPVLGNDRGAAALGEPVIPGSLILPRTCEPTLVGRTSLELITRADLGLPAKARRWY